MDQIFFNIKKTENYIALPNTFEATDEKLNLLLAQGIEIKTKTPTIDQILKQKGLDGLNNEIGEENDDTNLYPITTPHEINTTPHRIQQQVAKFRNEEIIDFELAFSSCSDDDDDDVDHKPSLLHDIKDDLNFIENFQLEQDSLEVDVDAQGDPEQEKDLYEKQQNEEDDFFEEEEEKIEEVATEEEEEEEEATEEEEQQQEAVEEEKQKKQKEKHRHQAHLLSITYQSKKAYGHPMKQHQKKQHQKQQQAHHQKKVK